MNSIPHSVTRTLPLFGMLLLSHLGASGFTLEEICSPSVASVWITPGASSSHDRIISPELAAILAVSLPKYDSSPRMPEKAAGDEAGELDPSHQVLRLPKHIVHGPRPPVFRERELHTLRGLSELAQRRYITQLDHGLNFFRLPLFGISVESRALAMYAEDERLQDMAGLDHTARDAALVDRAAGVELKRLADATYQRTSEYDLIPGLR